MSRLDSISAANEADRRQLTIPDEVGGRIPTLKSESGGHYGAMTAAYDSSFDEFVHIASQPSSHVLEIGAAYGTPYIMRALEQGAQNYTALDILGDQLRILAKRVRDHPKLGADRLSSIHLIDGAFPDANVISELEGTEYDGILATSVFHFLDEPRVISAFENVYRLLKPGAKLYARMGTPYLGMWKNECVEQWTQQIRTFLDESKTKLHRPYPVHITNVDECTDKQKLIGSKFLDIVNFVDSNTMFAFDADITRHMLEACNFVVEKCEYQPMNMEPFKRDGRERIIVIATKPLDQQQH